MSDAREALVRVTMKHLTDAHAYLSLRHNAETLTDAILAEFDVTPPDERVKPSVDDVARVIDQADDDWQHGIGNGGSMWKYALARAVLALIPGRTEAEVKAEALREAADWLADMDDGRDTAQHRAGRDIIARIRDRAARLSRGEGS